MALKKTRVIEEISSRIIKEEEGNTLSMVVQRIVSEFDANEKELGFSEMEKVQWMNEIISKTKTVSTTADYN